MGISKSMFSERSIVLSVSHPEKGEALIEGFRFIWAFYVKSYKPEEHCQPCFIGARVTEFCTPRAMTGRSVTCDKMDRYPYLYVCGVGSGPKDQLRHKNFHLPLKYEHGGVVDAVTYNGYRFRVENAAKVEVPPLEEGWQGKALEHTRCKNFQFAVAAFGYPPA